ncbi:choline dehydrogenase-like flavoprotein [Pantoea coffeiphila]|nr:choline dehydrogenase-like flavoprotein [Pantoea coffeiphila]
MLIEGIKLARQILAQPEFDAFRGKEMLPGSEFHSDEALLKYIQNYGATVFHPAGTCKMGSDAMSVVDPATLKVWGIDNLRIADVSIMPSLISGNTNAAAIMIGERVAATIINHTITFPPADSQAL